jgi:phosphoribosyl-ATP pyrophosphohydrolase
MAAPGRPPVIEIAAARESGDSDIHSHQRFIHMPTEAPTASTRDLGALLDGLWRVIEERRNAPPSESYTAKLLSRGIAKCAQKVGEEAVETAIAAAERNRSEVAAESADLLYHLLVLWAASGVTPDEVAAALAARKGVSGLVEKSARGD